MSTELRAVWEAHTTTHRDRKRLLRCLIEEVQLRTEEKHYHIRIVWKGGQIARILNKQGRRSGLGNPFTQQSITSLRGKHRIAKSP